MDARQERGLLLARDRRVRKVEGVTWLVPSQNRNAGGYVVNTLAQTCSCPDHETRRVKCKHLWAVELSQTVETDEAGATVTTETVKFTRKTYAQDWPAYNAAQCAEKGEVQTLLRSLCDGIQNPPHAGRGPKPVPLPDAVYGMVMKVYTTVSGRRATTDIEACAEAGHMAKAPRYNTLFDFMGRADLTPLLTSLIEESAAPLQCVESQFAVDSTGFGTAVYRRWFDAKYGHEMKEHAWLKAHAMVGVKTNIITAIHVTDSNVQDGTALPPASSRRLTSASASPKSRPTRRTSRAGTSTLSRQPRPCRTSPSSRTARPLAPPRGAACGACSCTDSPSFRRTTARETTSRRPSRRSRGSSAGPCVLRASPRR